MRTQARTYRAYAEQADATVPRYEALDDCPGTRSGSLIGCPVLEADVGSYMTVGKQNNMELAASNQHTPSPNRNCAVGTSIYIYNIMFSYLGLGS